MSGYVFNVVALGLAIFGIHCWLNDKTYIFEAEDIARTAKPKPGNHDSFVQSSKRFLVSTANAVN